MGTFIDTLQRALGLRIFNPHLPEATPQIERISNHDLTLLLRTGVSAAIDACPVTWGRISARSERPVAVAVHIAHLLEGGTEPGMFVDDDLRTIANAARASHSYREGTVPWQEIASTVCRFGIVPNPEHPTPQDTVGAYVGPSPLNQDTIETLVDLAREGKEADFRELAAMVGVRKDRLDGLWEGTRRKIRHA